MYVEIICAQDNDTFEEVQEIFVEQGYVEAINYLAQWDYGYESEHDFSLTEDIPRCIHEIRYKHNIGGDEYTLVEHPLYMALYRKAYED